MFHRDTCHSEIYQRSSRDKRFPREACLDLGDVKVVKEGGPQIERGMVFLRDTCHCFFFFHRNISGKRLPREGCSDQGDVKEERAVVTFSEEQDEDTLVAEGHQIGRGTVFLRDTCSVRFTRETFVDKRLPREACFDLGDVKVEMKRRMKTFSWRKDLKLNSSRCSTGTHATVRFTREHS